MNLNLRDALSLAIIAFASMRWGGPAMGADESRLLPAPTATPHALVISMSFYDSAEGVGSQHGDQPGAWGSFYIPSFDFSRTSNGDLTLGWEWEWNDPRINHNVTYFELHHPLFGCRSGRTIVDAVVGAPLGAGYFDLNFTYPATAHQLERPYTMEFTQILPPGTCSIAIHPEIADRLDGPSLKISALVLTPRKRFARIEYLPGSGLQGTLDYTFPAQTSRYDAESTILWWDGHYSDPGFWNLPLPAPAGPIRLTTSVDGYTSETVEFTPHIASTHDWKPLLAPIDGPGAGPGPSDLTLTTGGRVGNLVSIQDIECVPTPTATPTPTPAPTATASPAPTDTPVPSPSPSPSPSPEPSPTPTPSPSPSPIPSPSPTPEPTPCGDENGDYSIDSSDLLLRLLGKQAP